MSGEPRAKDENKARGARLRALRKARGWPARVVQEQSGRRLSIDDVSRMEIGRRAITADKLPFLAQGLRMPLEVVRGVIDGVISLDDAKNLVTETLPDLPSFDSPDSSPTVAQLTARMGEKVARLTQLSHALKSGLPNLELAILYAEGNGEVRWRPDTVAAARAGHCGHDDRMPKEWERCLDELNAELETLSTRWRQARP